MENMLNWDEVKNENFIRKRQLSNPIPINKFRNEYENIIENSNLEGKLQYYLYFIILFLLININFVPIIFSIQKELPSYTCIPDYELDLKNSNHQLFDKNKYVIIHSFTDKISQKCLDDKCSLHVEKSKTRDEEMKFPLFTPLPMLIVDLETVNSFLSNFFAYQNFCDMTRYEKKILYYMLLGKFIGYITLSIISEKLGRKFSIIIILTMLVISELLFFLINSFNQLLITILLFSTTNYFSTLSHIYAKEIMSKNYKKLLISRSNILIQIISIVYLLIIYCFRDWNILLIINSIVLGITLYLGLFYIVETPFYYLNTQQYKKLNLLIVKISKINFTYLMNVENMLMKLEKQKKFSQNVLPKIDTELSYKIIKDFELIDSRKNLGIRKTKYQNLRISIKHSFIFYFKLLPIVILYSGLNSFYYIQLFFMDHVCLIVSNNIDDLFYLLLVLFFLCKVTSQVIFDSYDFPNRNKKLLSCIFIILCILTGLFHEKIKIQNIYYRIFVFFVINVFTGIAHNILLQDLNNADNLRALQIETVLEISSSLSIFLFCYFFVVLADYLYFIFSIVYGVSAVTNAIYCYLKF